MTVWLNYHVKRRPLGRSGHVQKAARGIHGADVDAHLGHRWVMITPRGSTVPFLVWG